MAEGFDGGMNISVDTNIEPVADIPVEEPVVMEELESPIPAQELSELQNEADALEIQPLEEPSSLENIAAAAMTNVDSPSVGARAISGGINILTGNHLDPAASAATAQLVQMGMDAAPAAASSMMETAIRQHGKSPSVEYNEMLIQQAIEEKPPLDG